MLHGRSVRSTAYLAVSLSLSISRTLSSGFAQARAHKKYARRRRAPRCHCPLHLLLPSSIAAVPQCRQPPVCASVCASHISPCKGIKMLPRRRRAAHFSAAAITFLLTTLPGSTARAESAFAPVCPVRSRVGFGTSLSPWCPSRLAFVPPCDRILWDRASSPISSSLSIARYDNLVSGLAEISFANESTDPSDGDQCRANGDSTPGHTCATCGQRFETNHRLHQHLRDASHCVIDDHDDRPELCESSDDEDDFRDRSNEQRRLQASRVRQAVLDHLAGGGPMSDKSDPDGSVTGSPPGTDDGSLSVAVHDQDASGRETGPAPERREESNLVQP